MKTFSLLTMALATMVVGPVHADQKLVESKQCLGCHAMAQDGAAPAFKRIAARWQGRPEAEDVIVKTIRQGSAGTGGPHWNKAKMPDQAERPQVSEAEARQLAAWILAQ
ncbi:c-type cytochrome [Ideonella sp. YS5]|uniref:c-type cytochrome n=1 Tax=Ideonella sp. YS5 TaxID=3453714 RepID=UPI003EE91562